MQTTNQGLVLQQNKNQKHKYRTLIRLRKIKDFLASKGKTVHPDIKVKKAKVNICYSAISRHWATAEALRYMAHTKQRRTYLP